MSRLESIYQRLPVSLQNAACSLEGWRIQRIRYNSTFMKRLHEAEARTFWSEKELMAFRDERLRAFIQHCAATVPYYRQLFRTLGVHPSEIRALSDLCALPVLTKEMVQEHYAEFLSEAVPESARVVAHTSGTTGAGLRFATTFEAIHEQWATWWRYRRWHGIELGTWCGYFGGRSVVPISQDRPPFWRYNVPGRQILFSGYHMSERNMRFYVEELRRAKPPWLHGYPSLLALLAAYILDAKIDLGYQVSWVTIGAENLLPQQVELITRAFGVKPLQHYGMSEAVANISECPHGNLHVDEDFAAVEFVPAGGASLYKVIGTNFTNLATPLVRYDVGDIVMITETRCSCGRSGRLVTSIDGRMEDYVILRNGARLGRLDHIFKDLTRIREAQIYQPQVGEVVIRVVRGTGYTESDERQLLLEARKRLGEDTIIHVEYVEKLERSKTGKLRFVISDVASGKIQ